MKQLDDHELQELKKWAERSAIIDVPDLVLRCVHMAEELADVKFQRDQFEKAAKEWMDAFDTLKVKSHAVSGGLNEITAREISIAVYDFNETYEEKLGHCNRRAFHVGAWWAIDTMKGIK